MLLTVGDLVEEILVQLKEAPVRGQDTQVRSARIRGGSAANVAAIDAEMGGTPRLVCQVGDDAVGYLLAEDVRSRGVHVEVHHAGATGVIVTTVGLGVRSRLVDRGASRGPTTLDDLDLDGITQLYLAASAFTEDPLASAIEGLLASLTERRIPIVVGGPSTADLELLGVDAFMELIRTLRPDAVVLNRAEHNAVGCQPRQALAGARTTVVTAGSRPTLVLETSGEAESVPVAPVATIRDRTGAGDGFLAGFLASRRTGADAVAACHAGHRVAARVLQNVGPTTGR